MTKQYSVRMDNELSEKIDAIAGEFGVAAADVIRAAVAVYRPTRKSLDKAVIPYGLAAADEEAKRRVQLARWPEQATN